MTLLPLEMVQPLPRVAKPQKRLRHQGEGHGKVDVSFLVESLRNYL